MVSIGVYLAYPENPNFNYLTLTVSEKHTTYNITEKNQTVNMAINITVTGNKYPFNLNIFGQNNGLQSYSAGIFLISNYTGNASLQNASALISKIKTAGEYSAYLSNKFHHKVTAIPSFYYPSLIAISSNQSSISITLEVNSNISSGIYAILLNNIAVVSSHKSIVNTVYDDPVIVINNKS